MKSQIRSFSDVLLSQEESSPTQITYIPGPNTQFAIGPETSTYSQTYRETPIPSANLQKEINSKLLSKGVPTVYQKDTKAKETVQFITSQVMDDLNNKIEDSNKSEGKCKSGYLKGGSDKKKNVDEIIIIDNDAYPTYNNDYEQYIDLENMSEMQIQNIIYRNYDSSIFVNSEDENGDYEENEINE